MTQENTSANLTDALERQLHTIFTELDSLRDLARAFVIEVPYLKNTEGQKVNLEDIGASELIRLVTFIVTVRRVGESK